MNLYVWQTVAVTAMLWCLCCLPTFIITPINSILKYLACVVVYPKVRLTWTGLLACLPDVRALLQPRVYLQMLLLYLAIWWLWPSCRRLCRAIRPPVDLKDITKASRYIPTGYSSWRDLQTLWVNQIRKEYGAFKASKIINVRSCINLTSKLLDVFLVWKETNRLIRNLHSKTQSLVWRMTSYQISLHIRFWSFVAQGVCRMVIANPKNYLVGAHRDVLEKHTMKFLLFRCMPLRALSRLWGKLNALTLPVWLRPHAYRIYINMFGCKLHEANVTDLKQYANLGEFFRRSLKPNARPVDKAHCVTSPVDGTVLFSGQVIDGILEQVKGVTYSLEAFIGENTSFMSKLSKRASSREQTVKITEQCSERSANNPLSDFYSINVDFSCSQVEDEKDDICKDVSCHLELAGDDDVGDGFMMHRSTSFELKSQLQEHEAEFSKRLITNPASNILHQCIIYLAPGDYHRFHSPADWTICHRRHFPGNLFSVRPDVAGWLQGLFALNERVVYTGRWQYGFFSMTAVGATNVGTVNVFSDKTLKTNESNPDYQSYKEVHFSADHRGGIPMKRGELFGEFNLGSTIVLLFEAPADFNLKINSGDCVKYGQGMVANKNIKTKLRPNKRHDARRK